MRPQSGYTLIEVVIAVAILAMLATTGITIALAARPNVVTAAAMQFDQLLDSGRTIARQFNTGATIVFTPNKPDGFTATLYRNRPSTGTLVSTNVPPFTANVAITEQNTGAVPSFAIALHANGDVALIAAYDNSKIEAGCPSSGNYVIMLNYSANTVQRVLACKSPIASPGTAQLAPIASAPIETPGTVTPTCINCEPIVLPTGIAATCPPGYVVSGTATCALFTPAPSPAGTPTPCAYGGAPPYCSANPPPATPPPTPSVAPQPCTPDAAGYCWYNHLSSIETGNCGNVDGWHTTAQYGDIFFTVYNAHTGASSGPYHFVASYNDPTAEGDDECYTFAGWVGAAGTSDPTVLYPQDPDLGGTVQDELSIDLSGTSTPCDTEQQCEALYGFS